MDLISKLYSPSLLLTSFRKIITKYRYLFMRKQHCLELVFSSILCYSGLNTIHALFSFNSRMIFSNISMKRDEFFSLFPLIHPQMKIIMFSVLKPQKNFKLEKLFILNCYVHKNVRMYFRVYMWFHCFSSLMDYNNTELLFQISKLCLCGIFVFLLKTGCSECEKSKVAVRG